MLDVKKKIVLYNPKAVFYDMPLALLSIGSALDASKYDVKIIDGRIAKNAADLVLREVNDALCFGVTALTGDPLNDALNITRQVRKQFSDLPIIWGGWHPSLFPVKTLYDEPGITITVQGQGEETFKELVEILADGGNLSSVPGITYRSQNGEITKNPGRPLADMNLLPPVNYDLIDVEEYFIKKGRRQLDYISSTGCRFRCTFCADPFVFNRKWTAVGPERMGRELSYWHKKYQFTDVNFQDETFFTKRQRVIAIAECFLKNNIRSTWAGTMRADQGSRLSEQDFDLCKRAGLRRVLVGVESGSQVMLDWLSKDIKLHQVYETARRCAERDIHVIFPFIVGFPNETEQSVRETLKVARQLNAMHPGFTTPIFYYKPYPGSVITQEVVAQGYELPQNLEEWSRFDYIGSSGPWVSREKYLLIERFKFYNKLAGRRKHLALSPIQWLAKYRCKMNQFKFPIEKVIIEFLRPQKQLS